MTLKNLEPGMSFRFHRATWLLVSGSPRRCLKVKTGEIFMFSGNEKIKRIPKIMIGVIQ